MTTKTFTYEDAVTVAQKVVIIDPATGLASMPGAAPAGLTDAQLRAAPLSTTVYSPTAATATLAVTTASSAAQAVTAGEVVRFTNAGSAPIGITFGSSGVVAVAATSLDIMPGTAEGITVPAGATHFAAIVATGTGALKWTRGLGA